MDNGKCTFNSDNDMDMDMVMAMYLAYRRRELYRRQRAERETERCGGDKVP